MSKELCLELSPAKCTLTFVLCDPFEISANDTAKIKLSITVVSPSKACVLIESPEECLRDVHDQLYFLFRGLELEVYTARSLENCQDPITIRTKNNFDASDKNAIDLRQLITPGLVQRLEQQMNRFKTVVDLLYLLYQLRFIAEELNPLVLKLLIDTIIDNKTREIGQKVEEAKKLFDSLKNEFGIEKGEFDGKKDPVYWEIARECLSEESAKCFILLRIFRNIIAHMDGYPQFEKILRGNDNYAIFSSDCFEVGKYVVLKEWMQADDKVIKHLII